jgi:hypothetical protein
MDVLAYVGVDAKVLPVKHSASRVLAVSTPPTGAIVFHVGKRKIYLRSCAPSQTAIERG